MKKRAESLVRYSFKGPGWGRKSFTIYIDIKERDGKRSYKKVSDERLVAINKSLLLGLQSQDQCTIQVKEIVRDLYKKDSRCSKHVHKHNSENLDQKNPSLQTRAKALLVNTRRSTTGHHPNRLFC